MHWGANVGDKEDNKPNHRSFALYLFYTLDPMQVLSKNILKNTREQILKTLANAFMVYVYVVWCMLQSLG